MEGFSSTLPDYDNPPVNEVVFGIQFNKLKNLKAPHTGILWEKLGRDTYPECEERPPIAYTIESFVDALPQPPSITIEGLVSPFPRLLFITSSKDHLVQIQQER